METELKPIRIKDNVEVHNLIISKIRDYIELRNLTVGDKLPSERVLSETLNVSRRNVCEAIEKLELYGLVKSIPKTGIFVNTGRAVFSGVISGLLTLGEEDFLSIVEARLMLENKAVYFVASRRTDQDLEDIATALHNYKVRILAKENALEEDLLFHLAIAKASKNSVIYTMMLQLIPKINSVFVKTRVSDQDGFDYEIAKHEAIFEAIKNKDPEEAVRCMEFHFELLIDFCNDFKKRVL